MGKPAEDNVTEARLRIKPGWVTEYTDREPSYGTYWTADNCDTKKEMGRNHWKIYY